MWNLIGFSRRHNYSTAVEKDGHTTQLTVQVFQKVEPACQSAGITDLQRPLLWSYNVRCHAASCTCKPHDPSQPISQQLKQNWMSFTTRLYMYLFCFCTGQYIQTAVWGFKAWKDVNAVKTVHPACGKIKMAVGLWLRRVNNRLSFQACWLL